MDATWKKTVAPATHSRLLLPKRIFGFLLSMEWSFEHYYSEVQTGTFLGLNKVNIRPASAPVRRSHSKEKSESMHVCCHVCCRSLLSILDPRHLHLGAHMCSVQVTDNCTDVFHHEERTPALDFQHVVMNRTS